MKFNFFRRFYNIFLFSYSHIMDYIEKSKIVANAKIWIDGFDGFTPQELEVIKSLNKVSDVSIALSSDAESSELFLLNNKTLDKLKRFANLDIVSLDEQKRFEVVSEDYTKTNILN